MDVTKIRFFKPMTGDFAKGIIIPEKFVRNFNGQITEVVELKAASCETWHVGVDKIDDVLLLTSGWEDFVDDNELQENDAHMFTCCGNSSFEVLIFEAGGCEKLSSLFDHKTGTEMHKHLNDTEDTSVPSQLVGSTHKASTSKKHNCKLNQGKNLNPETAAVSMLSMKKLRKRRVMTGMKKLRKRRVMTAMLTPNSTTQGMPISLQRRKRRRLSVASIQPENPAFVAVLLKRHRQRRSNLMTVPSRFAADHLQERTQEFILCRRSRKDKWRIRYYYTSYIRGFQNLQFFKFVHDNKLREGDICVFELMKGAKRVTMTVHVIRKVGNRFVLVG